MRSPRYVLSGTALIAFMLLANTSYAHDQQTNQDRRTMIPHETILQKASREGTGHGPNLKRARRRNSCACRTSHRLHP
jgi:hypothetical protein